MGSMDHKESEMTEWLTHIHTHLYCVRCSKSYRSKNMEGPDLEDLLSEEYLEFLFTLILPTPLLQVFYLEVRSERGS